MSKTGLVTIVGIISIATIVAISIPLTSAKAETGHKHHGKMDMKAKPLSLEKILSGHLPMVSKSIDRAVKAVEAGNKQTALAELHKAQKMLVTIKEGIGRHVKPEFVNVRCPIMGSPVNLDKVAKNLIREYKGQKVAFCCAGCPATWDSLSDDQKNIKLAKVKPTPQNGWTCSMHPQIKRSRPGSCPMCNMKLIPASTQ
ncbi:MAG: heavy metal-binding domain-containing protein [Planctomycetota bacterium]|jgi:hypothetical protein